MKVNYLKEHKQLAATNLPTVIRQIPTPQNVYDILQDVLHEVRDLHNAYGVTTKPKPASLPDKALPINVYKNLERISYMINDMGNLIVKPSHVYQLAETIVWGVKRIKAHREIITLTPPYCFVLKQIAAQCLQ